VYGRSKLVEKVRDHYVRQLVDFGKVQREACGGGSAEVKFELSPSSQVYRRLYCVDFAAKVGDDAIIRELQPDRILSFEPFDIEVRGVAVRVEQLVWDDVQIGHDLGELAGEELDRWFNYWFDPDDFRLDPDAELGRTIHSLIVQPKRLSLDLGTATADAFWDILDLIAAAGASHIQVNSSRES
jgi:hypothetical protein